MTAAEKETRTGREEAVKQSLENAWQAPQPDKARNSREIWEYDFEEGKPSRELTHTLTVIILVIGILAAGIFLALHFLIG